MGLSPLAIELLVNNGGDNRQGLSRMYRITDCSFIAPEVKRFVVDAPQVARHWQAGQFVILRVDANGERIPLTVAAADRTRGRSPSSSRASARRHDTSTRRRRVTTLADVAGPLGKPSEIEHYGTAVVVGGGVGTAIAYPVVAALRSAGNRVIAIVGGRSRDYVLLEPEIIATGAEIIACTDDGSYGRHGFVTEALADVSPTNEVDVVFAAGPVPMMRAVAEVTSPVGIKTIASLNPIMVDGTGMCGGCRVDSRRGDVVCLCRRSRIRRPPRRLRPAGPAQPGVPRLRTRSRLRDLRPSNAKRRRDLSEPLSKKERMKLDRVAMPERDADERARSFEEVNLGFTAEMAKLEAMRCLECARPKCIEGCPVGIHIDEFVGHIARGDIEPAAAVVIQRDNLLPAICGTGLPPGEPMRGRLRPRQEGPPYRHRPSRALRRRLRAQRGFPERHRAPTVRPARASPSSAVALAGLACAGD